MNKVHCWSDQPICDAPVSVYITYQCKNLSV